MTTINYGWQIWLGFSLFIVLALSLDTFVIGNSQHSPHHSMRKALTWSLIWIATTLLFNVLLWFYLYNTTTPLIAKTVSLNFLTGYLIEKSLSIDNLFAFYLIFQQLHIPPHLQHRVFSIGIWSAIVLRLVIILASSWLIQEVHSILYVMGAFLLFTGIKMGLQPAKEKDLHSSRIYILLTRHLRITSTLSGQAFFIRINKLIYMTPLFIALIFIETTDIIFAFDSIPAIFAITTDPFIVWTSTIFAILGLRALYFLLASLVKQYSLLKYAIATILVFVGAKMLIEPWVTIPSEISLLVVLSILALFTALS